MTKKPAQKTSRLERTRKLAEKVATYEHTLKTIAEQTSGALQQIKNALISIVSRLEVLEGFQDASVLMERTQALQLRKAKEEIATVKAALEKLVQEGKFVAVPAVTEKSIVIAIEKDSEGLVVEPGRIQVAYEQFKPELKPAFLNQKVGFSYTLPNGHLLELQEVYEVVE